MVTSWLPLTYSNSTDISVIATKVTNLSNTPKVQDLEAAFQGLDNQIKYLTDIYANLERDLGAEVTMVREELERCVSEASAGVMRSHLTATERVVKIMDAKDATTTEAISQMKNRLEDLDKSQSRTQRFHRTVREELGKLEAVENLNKTMAELEKQLREVAQELSAWSSKQRSVTVWDVAQAAGVAIGVITGVANLITLRAERSTSNCYHEGNYNHTSTVTLPERIENHPSTPGGHSLDRELTYSFEDPTRYYSWDLIDDLPPTGELEIPIQVRRVLY